MIEHLVHRRLRLKAAATGPLSCLLHIEDAVIHVLLGEAYVCCRNSLLDPPRSRRTMPAWMVQVNVGYVGAAVLMPPPGAVLEAHVYDDVSTFRDLMLLGVIVVAERTGTVGVFQSEAVVRLTVVTPKHMGPTRSPSAFVSHTCAHSGSVKSLSGAAGGGPRGSVDDSSHPLLIVFPGDPLQRRPLGPLGELLGPEARMSEAAVAGCRQNRRRPSVRELRLAAHATVPWRADRPRGPWGVAGVRPSSKPAARTRDRGPAGSFAPMRARISLSVRLSCEPGGWGLGPGPTRERGLAVRILDGCTSVATASDSASPPHHLCRWCLRGAAKIQGGPCPARDWTATLMITCRAG